MSHPHFCHGRGTLLVYPSEVGMSDYNTAVNGRLSILVCTDLVRKI